MAKSSLKSMVTSGLRAGLRNSKPENVTKGNGVKNPQKATAYVGKGVLKNGGSITPVPNGHLIKKDGTSLKNGGKVSAAWQRKEGKNPSGGLNAKGRASYNRANPGKPGLKAPQPEGGPRKKSFCARMSGMKKKLTSAKTANDPNSRINKSLRKWKC
jgi:hypothetical protein